MLIIKDFEEIVCFFIFYYYLCGMKRFFLLFVISLMGLTLGAQTTYETGVSQQLAEHRAATIHGLEYSLFFSIPEDKSADISAREVVSFALDAKEEIALDFREGAENIHSVRILGKKTDIKWRLENRHLIIPAKYTRRGKNAFQIEFTAGNQSLNRNDEYMYTLFVPDRARTCFPCFDQPDLKAKFTLKLKVPRGWKAVANSPLVNNADGILTFAQSEMLPTYLFAFAAGKFQYKEHTKDGRSIGAYYRETDPDRIAQLPEIFRQVDYALRWHEDFTDQPYPFAKYDLVILPGFQFGGMEHTGCTFYSDQSIFLSKNPTPDELLWRANLIAHETSHMWYGDFVTMRWFSDVWAKEVFANYFAVEITQPQFPDFNYDLYWVKSFKQPAVLEDMTEGRTAIQQPLDNMRNAGLIYNNIIYNKAPLVLREMVRMMGKETFRSAIQRGLKKFAYGNASWDELINSFEEEFPHSGIKEYSDRWIKQPYYPEIRPSTFLFNPDGREYGYFNLSAEQIDSLMHYWPNIDDATARESYLLTLYENYLKGNVSAEEWTDFLLCCIPNETDPLALSTLVYYLRVPIWDLDSVSRNEKEARLWEMAENHPVKSCRLHLIRFLSQSATSDFVNKQMYVLWRYCDNELLSIADYMSMAYELALHYPSMAKEILAEEEGRIVNPDRLRQFQYISRAVSPDKAARDSLFQWLLVPENRRIEPWAAAALYYLNHPILGEESADYILPGLEALQDIQRTGDIFFPGRWCSSLLTGHKSKKALDALNTFLDSHPDYPPLLRNKILTAAFYLQRQ